MLEIIVFLLVSTSSNHLKNLSFNISQDSIIFLLFENGMFEIPANHPKYQFCQEHPSVPWWSSVSVLNFT